jgi:predicted NAD-dependent protein-ADP-ribosyltransferase YbiA (DUF1768 family)
MDEYLENLGTFYDEKIKFLSQKDKFTNCNGCEDKKEFKELYEELSLTCGGKEGSKCGTQIIIKLPKYLHYESVIDGLQEKLNEMINFEAINNYMKIDDLKEKKDLIDEIKNEIKKIEDIFIEENIKNKQKIIQEFYDKRIKKTKRCRLLLNNLKKIEDISEKKLIKKEYVQNIIELNKEYSEIQNLISDINPYLLAEDPKVTIKNINYEITPKKIKKKEKKNDLQIGDNVYYTLNDEPLNGIIKSLKGKKAIILNEKNKKVMILLSDLTKVDPDKGFALKLDKGDIIRVGELSPGSPESEEPEPESEEPEPESEEPEPESEEPEPEINYFSGSKKYKWLSSFNTTNPETDETLNPFKYEGIEYPSVEHAFHAQKIEVGHPKEEEYKLIFSTTNDFKPNDAKRFGGRKYFEDNNFKLRNDWGKIKLKLMKDITREYYLANRKMIDKLLETGNIELIHKGFRIDNYWGVNKNGGENNHGKILMELRNEFSN